MAEFLKDKPSSRVLRPPGGATSNIFGGAEERSEPSRSAKPTFQSSVFNNDPNPVQTNSKNRPSVTDSSIFAPESGNTNQNSPKKVSKTHQSSIFGESDTNNASKTDSHSRYDPITGTVIGRPSSSTSDSSNTSDRNQATSDGTANTAQATDTTNKEVYEPHLGPVKSDSGIRCAQPPGGKSTFSLF